MSSKVTMRDFLRSAFLFRFVVLNDIGIYDISLKMKLGYYKKRWGKNYFGKKSRHEGYHKEYEKLKSQIEKSQKQKKQIFYSNKSVYQNFLLCVLLLISVVCIVGSVTFLKNSKFNFMLIVSVAVFILTTLVLIYRQNRHSVLEMALYELENPGSETYRLFIHEGEEQSDQDKALYRNELLGALPTILGVLASQGLIEFQNKSAFVEKLIPLIETTTESYTDPQSFKSRLSSIARNPFLGEKEFKKFCRLIDSIDLTIMK